MRTSKPNDWDEIIAILEAAMPPEKRDSLGRLLEHPERKRILRLIYKVEEYLQAESLPEPDDEPRTFNPFKAFGEAIAWVMTGGKVGHKPGTAE